MKIASSVLAADFLNLKNEMHKTRNTDYLHLDVMDGHFVPNISYGADVIKALKTVHKADFDVHLMMSRPDIYIEKYVDSGADIISFHVECEADTRHTIEKIKSFGVKPALAIKPGTNIDEILPYLDEIYMVLVMTVEPGFGGQKIMLENLEKVKELKKIKPNLILQVDGGIGRGNIHLCKEAGVDICVCGTSVFGSDDPYKEIEYLQSI